MPVKTKKQWYAIYVETNTEARVKKDVKRQAKIEDLDHHIGKIISPVEKVQEKRNTSTGTKNVTRSEKKLPGYLVVFCELTDDVLYLFKETKGVFGFLPLDAQPVAIPGPEVEHILELDKKLNGEKPTKKVVLNFKVGDQVRVTGGAFRDCTGKVKSIAGSESDPSVTVTVVIFGREVEVPNLPYHQVKKS